MKVLRSKGNPATRGRGAAIGDRERRLLIRRLRKEGVIPLSPGVPELVIELGICCDRSRSSRRSTLGATSRNSRRRYSRIVQANKGLRGIKEAKRAEGKGRGSLTASKYHLECFFPWRASAQFLDQAKIVAKAWANYLLKLKVLALLLASTFNRWK